VKPLDNFELLAALHTRDARLCDRRGGGVTSPVDPSSSNTGEERSNNQTYVHFSEYEIPKRT